LEIKKEVKDTQMIVLKSSVFVGYFIWAVADQLN
jgi:hypothetical protein